MLAHGDHTSLPGALLPLIPPFCFILYSECTMHPSIHPSVLPTQHYSPVLPSGCTLHGEAFSTSPPCCACIVCVCVCTSACVCECVLVKCSWLCWPSAMGKRQFTKGCHTSCPSLTPSQSNHRPNVQDAQLILVDPPPPPYVHTSFT